MVKEKKRRLTRNYRIRYRPICRLCKREIEIGESFYRYGHLKNPIYYCEECHKKIYHNSEPLTPEEERELDRESKKSDEAYEYWSRFYKIIRGQKDD